MSWKEIVASLAVRRQRFMWGLWRLCAGGAALAAVVSFVGFLGWQGVLVTLVVASLIGSIVGLVVMIFQGRSLKLAIPFGPFLALGAVVHLFWGTELMEWYLNPHLG